MILPNILILIHIFIVQLSVLTTYTPSASPITDMRPRVFIRILYRTRKYFFIKTQKLWKCKSYKLKLSCCKSLLGPPNVYLKIIKYIYFSATVIWCTLRMGRLRETSFKHSCGLKPWIWLGYIYTLSHHSPRQQVSLRFNFI